MSAPSTQVLKGSTLIYRNFDVAEEIDLPSVERILASGTRVKLSRGNQYALFMRDAPLRVALGNVELKIGEKKVTAQAQATVWDYGAFSILFQVPIEVPMSGSDFVNWASLIQGDESKSQVIDSIARKMAQDLASALAPALKRASDSTLFEDYVIYFLESVSGIEKASEVLDALDVPAILLGESKDVLSKQSKNSILENVFQYSENDLVAIDWNSALVYEPSGLRDIPDVLEFAVSHLLELRYYDDLIDRRLSELYDAVEAERHGLWRTRFSALSREANTRYLEFSEFVEKVDNSLKVVGDFYLATIFRGATRRFRIQDWQTSIARKLTLLSRLSELLQGEINVRADHTMELVVIVLIAFELISALFRH
jgi:hypothetical protein